MKKKSIIWDYPQPLKDEIWLAGRLAEFFPFVADQLTDKDKKLILKHLEKIYLPPERKRLIRMVCHEK